MKKCWALVVVEMNDGLKSSFIRDVFDSYNEASSCAKELSSRNNHQYLIFELVGAYKSKRVPEKIVIKSAEGCLSASS